MILSALRILGITRKLKICLLCVIAIVSLFILFKSFYSTSDAHILEIFKLSSPCVLRFYSLSSPDVHKSFNPTVNASELHEMMDLMQTFSAVLTNASLTYFLISGSLLGSWRHHGIVPWDDDLDVAILSAQQESVQKVLGNLQPNYFLDVSRMQRWKFYSSRGQPVRERPWKWPYVDIGIYFHDGTHLVDPTFSPCSHPLDDVFPLRERPFMGMMLPAPNDTEAVLTQYLQTSNLNMCEPNAYDHRRERWITADKAVPCEELAKVYPFVWRQPAGGVLQRCNESLVLNGSVLSWVVLNATRC